MLIINNQLLFITSEPVSLNIRSLSFGIGIVLIPATYMTTTLFTGSKNSNPFRSYHQIHIHVLLQLRTELTELTELTAQIIIEMI